MTKKSSEVKLYKFLMEKVKKTKKSKKKGRKSSKVKRIHHSLRRGSNKKR